MLLRGDHVELRPAVWEDRESVYQWLTQSDLTPEMLGPPNFPDCPAPTFAEFCRDYERHYWDGSDPQSARSFIILADGRMIGHCNYDRAHGSHNGAELDIWLASRSVTGKGFGADALKTLCNHLRHTLGVSEFVIRPSRRNRNAVRAYEKAGFREVDPPPALRDSYPPGDYFDAVFMVKNLESGLE
jgi:RimJ/RimL family protein N-acetyltransferase